MASAATAAAAQAKGFGQHDTTGGARRGRGGDELESAGGSGKAYIGHATGVAGTGPAGAEWLAGHRRRAVGGDTIAFECVPAWQGHRRLPVSRILLAEAGINIIETCNLEALARDGVCEFLAAVVPLRFGGATGSQVRPLAMADHDG